MTHREDVWRIMVVWCRLQMVRMFLMVNSNFLSILFYLRLAS